MVRPVALRLTRGESELLNAWVAVLQPTLPNASASDVMRRALVAAAFDAISSEEWARIARENRVAEEWGARISSNGPLAPWREVEKKIATAPGDDSDRQNLRKRVQRAVDDTIADHFKVYSCSRCGAPFTGKDLEEDRGCQQCGADEEDVPF